VDGRALGAVRRRLLVLARPLTVPAFRRLWLAQLISEVGDWSARLVLAYLVFERTGSPAVTSLVTTISLVPWLGPGQLLTALSERWPRRRVMVVADVVRAVAFGVAGLPLPIPVLLGVVFCAGLATPAFEAARAAVRPEILPRELYPPAVALTGITQDLTVAIGAALGGGLVALLGTHPALAVNAASFAASAGFLAGLPAAAAARRGPLRGALRISYRALRRDPLIVRAVLLVTAAMLTATSMTALTVPLSREVLGAGPAAVGGLIAIASVVSIVATAAVPTDGDPAQLLRWAAGYALLGGGLTTGCYLAISLGSGARSALAAVGYLAAGLLFAVLAPANVVVSPRLPGDIRASALSLLMGALVATEALGAAVAGWGAAAAGILPMCILLGGPPIALGGYCMLRPVRDM